MAKTLLVIDMQNICVGKNNAKIFNYDKDKLITEINKKISSVTIPKSLVGTTFTKQADKYNAKLTKMGVIWKN